MVMQSLYIIENCIKKLLNILIYNDNYHNYDLIQNTIACRPGMTSILIEKLMWAGMFSNSSAVTTNTYSLLFLMKVSFGLQCMLVAYFPKMGNLSY